MHSHIYMYVVYNFNVLNISPIQNGKYMNIHVSSLLAKGVETNNKQTQQTCTCTYMESD